jgi:hypothetical protein
VDAIDGFVMAMSPWAVRELRFDESLGKLHGYDLDMCLQARAAGRKVITEDFRVVHHHSLELTSDIESWIEAHIRVAEKWDGRMPNVGATGGDWKQRARRAEAEAAAARLHAASIEYRAEALEWGLEKMRRSVSWRITAPLRWMKRLAKRLTGRGRSRPDRPEPPGA